MEVYLLRSQSVASLGRLSVPPCHVCPAGGRAVRRRTSTSSSLRLYPLGAFVCTPVARLSSRWSRREEADFYRVVSTFGIERDVRTGELCWDTFRGIARLDKKYNDTLGEYFRAFYHMCRRICMKLTGPEDGGWSAATCTRHNAMGRTV